MSTAQTYYLKNTRTNRWLAKYPRGKKPRIQTAVSDAGAVGLAGLDFAQRLRSRLGAHWQVYQVNVVGFDEKVGSVVDLVLVD